MQLCFERIHPLDVARIPFSGFQNSDLASRDHSSSFLLRLGNLRIDQTIESRGKLLSIAIATRILYSTTHKGYFVLILRSLSKRCRFNDDISGSHPSKQIRVLAQSSRKSSLLGQAYTILHARFSRLAFLK